MSELEISSLIDLLLIFCIAASVLFWVQLKISGSILEEVGEGDAGPCGFENGGIGFVSILYSVGSFASICADGYLIYLICLKFSALNIITDPFKNIMLLLSILIIRLIVLGIATGYKIKDKK